MDYSNIRERYKDVDSSWTKEQEQILLEPYTYILANPGKEVRSMLVNAFNIWLKVPEPELDIVRNIVRMLHNASLLMDDVEDNSELRRGQPVAHTVYGVPQTINTANYVYFLAMQDLVALKTTASRSGSGAATPAGAGQPSQDAQRRRRKAEEADLFGLVTDELLNLHRGQGLELFWRDSLTCPTEEEYMQMVLGKTGGLFRIAVKLMMAMSECDTDFVPLVNLISIYFQIRDDYMNLQSAEYADNKGFCEDLTEGKFSFPVVHGIRADPSNHQILNVLQKRTNSHALKAHTVDYLRRHTKSFEYTRGVLVTIKEQLDDELRILGGNPALEAILRKLDLPKDEDPAQQAASA